MNHLFQNQAFLLWLHVTVYGALTIGMGLNALTWGLGWSLLLACGLIAASTTDARKFIIPDWASLGLIVFGIAATAVLRPDSVAWHVLTAIAWFLALGVLSEIYLRWKGIDGLGLGDAKLMAAGGAWLGPYESPSVLLIASVAGIAILTGFRIVHGRLIDLRTQRLPFGVILSLSIWYIWLYGAPRLPGLT